MGRPIFQEYCIESRVRATLNNGNISVDGIVAVNGMDVWMTGARSHDEAAELAKQEARRYADQLYADPPRHEDAVEYRNGAEFVLRSWQ